jgi:glutamine synthetase
MNPHFALSAIFALGLRGVEKKLELNVVPAAQMTQEDKRSGRVRWAYRQIIFRRALECLGFHFHRSRCCLSRSKPRRSV